MSAETYRRPTPPRQPPTLLRHAVCKHTFGRLAHFVWWRVACWLRTLHRWGWKDFRRRFTTPQGTWKPLSADGITLFNIEAVPVTRYRWRANNIPSPWVLTPASREHPWRARCVETRTPGSASGLGKRIRSNPDTAPQADLTYPTDR